MTASLGSAIHIAVVGLGFGDEGKGSVVDHLARRRPSRGVVRFNGGPQAAHHVVAPDGRVHCFAQIGAAMLADPEIQSFSTNRVMVEPLGLLREAQALEALGVEAPLGRLRLDERSVVVTPFHRLMNRALEVARGQGRHGSCGLGVGQAYTDALNPSLPSVRVGELREPEKLRRKLNLMRLMKLDLVDQLAAEHKADLSAVLAELRRTELIDVALRGYAELLERVPEPGQPTLERVGFEAYEDDRDGPLLFEGAQGVLLDEHHGFWPHVTPSTTTFAWADEWRRRQGKLFRLGVLRAFSTRHGAGPFVAELRDPPAELLRGEHNGLGDWQGGFRVGWFDLLMARYALAVAGGVDGLALTCLDRLAGLPEVGLVTGWRYEGEPAEVDDLFDLQRTPGGAAIHAVRMQEAPSRERQARLTAALGRCSPVIERVEGWRSPEDPAAARFVERVERELRCPVALLSWGATAGGKKRAPT